MISEFDQSKNNSGKQLETDAITKQPATTIHTQKNIGTNGGDFPFLQHWFDDSSWEQVPDWTIGR